MGVVPTWTQRMHFAYHGCYQYERIETSRGCILGFELPDYCSSDQREITDGAPGGEKQ